MAFPTTGLLDDFNRADNPTSLGASWGSNIQGGYASAGILSNQAYAGGGFQDGYWNTSFGADQEAYFTIAVMTTTVLRIFARIQNPGASPSYYVLNIYSSGAFDTAYSTAGSENPLSPNGGAGTFTTNDLVGLECIGTTISMYRKRTGTWTQVGTTTDSNVTGAGFIGFQISGTDTVVRIDDFSGGGAPGPTVAWIRA